MNEAGKGDKRRPGSDYEKNYDQIDWSAKSNEPPLVESPVNPAVDYVRRLAEDWAENCIEVGYVTTINSSSYRRFVSELNALNS